MRPICSAEPCGSAPRQEPSTYPGPPSARHERAREQPSNVANTGEARGTKAKRRAPWTGTLRCSRPDGLNSSALDAVERRAVRRARRLGAEVRRVRGAHGFRRVHQEAEVHGAAALQVAAAAAQVTTGTTGDHVRHVVARVD